MGNLLDSMEIPKKEKGAAVFEITPLDGVFEHAIREGKNVGQGKDGIVFKINLGSFSEDEIVLLRGEGITVGQDEDIFAAKILKVYRPGEGAHEFLMQQKVLEILNEEGAMRVPGVFVARQQHLSNDTRTFLNSQGAQLEDRAEMVVMDYVDGKDLGTIMYEEVLRDMGYEEDYIEAMTYSEKEQQVGHELGFIRPAPASTAEEKVVAENLEREHNEELLLKYLKKRNFLFPTGVIEKIEMSLHLMRKNGLHHNDLHKRNVMIDNSGEVFLVDFGRTDFVKKEGAIDDGAFLKRWRDLFLSESEASKEKHVAELTQMDQLKERLLSNPKQKELMRSLILSMREVGISTLQKELALSRGNDVKFERFLVFINLLLDSSEVSDERKREIRVFQESLTGNDSKLRPFEINLLKRCKDIGFL
jgi:hypothetical protein